MAPLIPLPLSPCLPLLTEPAPAHGACPCPWGLPLPTVPAPTHGACFSLPTPQCYDVCNQAAMALALGSGSVPASLQKDILQKLVTDITTTQSNHITVRWPLCAAGLTRCRATGPVRHACVRAHAPPFSTLPIQTGIIGAKALFPVLSKMGQQAVAVSLAEQVTYPSWGTSVPRAKERGGAGCLRWWRQLTRWPCLRQATCSTTTLKTPQAASGSCGTARRRARA